MPRERLPNRRRSETIKAVIGGSNIYFSVARFRDGRIAECFVKLNKEGTAMYGMMASLAIAISIGLQHGVPLETFTNALRGVDFQPNGPVLGNERVPTCTSVVDYLVRALAAEAEQPT
jgi:ribonucleoside-diphosphate reductase alpha chain